MSVEVYLLFLAATAALIATPGPNVALIVSTSLAHGARAGLLTVAGVNAGLILQLGVVAFGLSWIVEAFARHFDLIRYLGAAYLGVLGVQQLLAAPATTAPEAMPRAHRAFARGFAVAFANPKTLIFHAAFLPQFLAPGAGAAQLWLLVGSFAVIAAAGDSLYALMAARLRAAASRRAQHLANRASGIILLGGSAVLLAMGRR